MPRLFLNILPTLLLTSILPFDAVDEVTANQPTNTGHPIAQRGMSQLLTLEVQVQCHSSLHEHSSMGADSSPSISVLLC
jgi:hypothetical protein